jgi:hypothetical protein
MGDLRIERLGPRQRHAGIYASVFAKATPDRSLRMAISSGVRP